jgi:hypothetical protein
VPVDLLTRLVKYREPDRNPEQQAALLQDLTGLISVRIQNVANYYFLETDKGQLDFRHHFPNVAPPWPFFFMSFKAPAYELRHGKLKPNQNAGVEVGYEFFTARDEATGEWEVKCLLLYSASSRDMRIRTLGWRVSKDGQILSIDGSEVKSDKVRLSVSQEVDWHGRTYGQSPLPSDLLCLPLLAISFCHCKNVDLIREPVPPKVKAKRERAYGWSPDAWHTLKIEPMQRQLHSVGAKDPAGLKRALHICRGHFKDYREGRGLFGKTHGIWWWDFHLTDSSHRHQYEIEQTDKPTVNIP